MNSILFDNLIILDFFNNQIFNDDDFYDTDHLNQQGARKLTLEVKKILTEKEIRS